MANKATDEQGRRLHKIMQMLQEVFCWCCAMLVYIVAASDAVEIIIQANFQHHFFFNCKIFHSINYFLQDGCGHWVSLDSELEMRAGEVCGTKTPTGHSLLLDCRFELPFGKRERAKVSI